MNKKILYSLIFFNIAAGTYFATTTRKSNQSAQQKKKVRVYVDMVGDLFHYGHVKMLKQAKSMGDELVVGINSDEDVASYKRVPYLTMQERIKSAKGCRYVDEVIGNAPLKVTKKFIEKHNIDLVIHGDDWPIEMLNDYYKDAIELGKFKTVPYTKGVSTSDIIRRVQARKTA